MSRTAAFAILAVAFGLASDGGAVVVSQSDMDENAAAELAQVDGEMNAYYQVVMKEYAADPVFIEKLRAAQRAWLVLRDAEVAVAFPHAGEPGYYGSALSTCLTDLKVALTRRRVQELRRWLQGGKEGDVCAGSLKMEKSRALP